MSVTKHSSKNSASKDRMLKELKKYLDAGATQIAITLEEDEENPSKNVYMLVVHGSISCGNSEKVEGE